MGKYTFSVDRTRTYLNGRELLAVGLRCSNALWDDASTEQLIANLDIYRSYGVNTVSVFLMGNRFSDTRGYREEGTLSPQHASRLNSVIGAADALGMVVLVGCLYWGTTSAKWKSWRQADANRAIESTVLWLRERDHRNVFIDVDNEGMGRANKGFDTREMILVGKSVDSSYLFASNYIGEPPDVADLSIHFADRIPEKPYIETEGVPHNAPGGYWQDYSKAADSNNKYRYGHQHYNYRNVGVYSEEMKRDQIEQTLNHLDGGMGYLMASTWLQATPPNHDVGGNGSADDPGIRWWLEALRDRCGSYHPPKKA